MSIFASLAAPDDQEHEDGCAALVLIEQDTYEVQHERCDCGQPDAPLVYRGSHILPSENDERGGDVDIALIPGHITRDGRDDKDDDEEPWPYLRFGVNEGTVILTRRNVEQVAAQLTWWLERTKDATP